MKILIDASLISVGGGVQVALSIINNISDDLDFEVICVTNPEIDKQLSQETKSKIKYYYVESIVPLYEKYNQGKRLSLIEKKHNPDFIFIVFGPSYWKPKNKCLQGFALGKMLYQKELNIGFFEKILNITKAIFFKWAKSYLVVETELVKTKLSSYLNYPENKIFVIGNSYSPEFNNNIIEKKSEIKPPNDFFTFLVPGSYYPHKNLERLISSLILLKKRCQNHTKKIKFLFTIPKDSGEWMKLYKFAQINEVNDLIDTVGFIENSKFGELYLKSNAVICASLVESSTAVFPESFLAMKPLLVSDRPFAHELCENAALYFDPLNVASIADVIWSLIIDESLQDMLVQNGQYVLLKNYPSAEQKWALQKKLIVELANK